MARPCGRREGSARAPGIRWSEEPESPRLPAALLDGASAARAASLTRRARASRICACSTTSALARSAARSFSVCRALASRSICGFRPGVPVAPCFCRRATPPGDSQTSRAVSRPIPGVDVGAVREQRLDEGIVPRGCQVQRRGLRRVLHVGAGAVVEEQAHHADVALHDRVIEERPLFLGGSIGIRAAGEQQGDELDAAGLGRPLGRDQERARIRARRRGRGAWPPGWPGQRLRPSRGRCRRSPRAGWDRRHVPAAGRRC